MSYGEKVEVTYLFWKLWEKEHLLRLRERIPLEHKLSQLNLNPKLEVQ